MSVQVNSKLELKQAEVSSSPMRHSRRTTITPTSSYQTAIDAPFLTPDLEWNPVVTLPPANIPRAVLFLGNSVQKYQLYCHFSTDKYKTISIAIGISPNPLDKKNGNSTGHNAAKRYKLWTVNRT